MINNFDGLITSRSIMSLGKGTSGFSPVSTVGMLAFLISFSTNPVQFRQSMIQYSTTIQTSYLRCPQWNEKSFTGWGGKTRLNVNIETQISKLHSCGLTGSVTGWITGREQDMVPLARAEDVSESRLTQFPVHLLTSPHFIHKLALEHVYIWVQLWVEKKEGKQLFWQNNYRYLGKTHSDSYPGNQLEISIHESINNQQ